MLNSEAETPSYINCHTPATCLKKVSTNIRKPKDEIEVAVAIPANGGGKNQSDRKVNLESFLPVIPSTPPHRSSMYYISSSPSWYYKDITPSNPLYHSSPLPVISRVGTPEQSSPPSMQKSTNTTNTLFSQDEDSASAFHWNINRISLDAINLIKTCKETSVCEESSQPEEPRTPKQPIKYEETNQLSVSKEITQVGIPLLSLDMLIEDESAFDEYV
jgi:hypothetical protein